MDENILLQKQIRDNSEDLRTYLKDLAEWEKEMKRKESELLNEPVENKPISIVRDKSLKTRENKVKKTSQKKVEKRIKSFDYAAWEKFDVDAECEKLDASNDESEVEEEPSEEYKAQLRDEANYEKERGNQFVKNKKWDEAIACYTHALACYEYDPIYYANRALCFLKKNDAEADCTSALRLQPNYVKALQRRAAAREGLKQYQEALDDLNLVIEIEPQNHESKRELERLEKRLGVFSPKSAESKLKNIFTIVDKKQENKPKEAPERSVKIAETNLETVNKIPWPDRSYSEIILPVQKLPHQRSKKPLRRIVIEENESNDINLIDDEKRDIDYNDSENLAKILSKSNKMAIDEMFENTQTDKTESNLIMEDEKSIEEPNNYKFTAPKTSVQFYSQWKIIKSNNHKYLFLKDLDPLDIPHIFKDSLESNVFSEIISILSEYFTENKLNIFTYLTSLSNVKRFSALIMFMTSKDRINLQKLFAHCEKFGEASIEDLKSIKKKYEL